MDIKLAFLGFGGVGRALVEMLEDKKELLARDHDLSVQIVGVSDMYQGSVIDQNGISPAALLATPREKGSLALMPDGSAEADNDKLLDDSGADILVEVSFTNPVDGEPARSFCRRAAKNGMKVVTTNKGPVAFGLDEVESESTAKGLAFGYEGSVMSGTPVLSFARECLPAANITKFRGIMNGTSNFILGRMESGAALEPTIKEAQELGYAEADPTADIEGYDVMMKVIIMSKALFGETITPNDVERSGITGITPGMIEEAAIQNKRYKLIGSGERMADGSYKAAVKAECLPATDLLYGISGAVNAITLTCDELGDIMVSGPGAGLKETAYALLADIIFAQKAAR